MARGMHRMVKSEYRRGGKEIVRRRLTISWGERPFPERLQTRAPIVIDSAPWMAVSVREGQVSRRVMAQFEG